MPRVTFGGAVNNTAYRTSFSNNYLYSDYTSGWPAGNPSSDGGSPVLVSAAGADFTTGATYVDIQYFGGPGFRIRVGHVSGSLGAGRNTLNGSTMVDSADGDSVAGGICGWFDWYTVPGAPAMIQATAQEAGKVLVQFSGSGDDGGAGVLEWQYQYAVNPAFTAAGGPVSSSGTSTFTGTPGTLYYFRARGRNAAGWSAWSNVLSARAKSGGKVSIGGAFRTGITKVSIGGVWHDAIVKVSIGGVWKDAL